MKLKKLIRGARFSALMPILIVRTSMTMDSCEERIVFKGLTKDLYLLPTFNKIGKTQVRLILDDWDDYTGLVIMLDDKKQHLKDAALRK